MPIKTVSLEVDAYDILSRARKHPRESFSCVVRRARWDGPQYTGAALLSYMHERMRRGTTLSEPSLQHLHKNESKDINLRSHKGAKATTADAYIVDGSFLAALEFEVKAGVDGSALVFLADKSSAVFRVCVITSGEFSAALADADMALGNQVLGQFEIANLSSPVAERYSREAARLESEAGQKWPRLNSNDVWVGCTAVVLNTPLLTRRAERYADIQGLRLIEF